MGFPAVTLWLIMAQWQVLLAFTMSRSEASKCPLLSSWSCTTTVMEMVKNKVRREIVATQEELRPAPALTIIQTHLAISNQKEAVSVHILKTW